MNGERGKGNVLRWLYIAVLMLMGVPIMTGWPLNIMAEHTGGLMPEMPELGALFVWVVYASFLWSFIFWIAGEKRLLEYLSAAFMLGLTTAILGALVRKVLPFLALGLTEDEISWKMVKLFVTTITVVPYMIFLLSNVSAKKLVDKFSKMKGKSRIVGLHFALALRVFQHTGEVISCLLDIWSEEHPEKGVPRHRRDWQEKWYSKSSLGPWVVGAVSAWIFACAMQALEPVPAMVDEIETVNNNYKGG